MGCSAPKAARDRAKGTVESFEAFIAEHKDEITALQILYQQPQRMRGQQVETLTFEALKAQADTLQAPPHLWTEGQLWQAYAALDKSKVKGENRKRILTDLVSLVRFAMHQYNELVPFPERVNANFKAWLAQQTQAGTTFTSEQLHWLDMIREHIAGNLTIVPDDFEYSPSPRKAAWAASTNCLGQSCPRCLRR